MNKKMIRLGITGGLGSGKSRTAEYFSRLGAVVWDADAVAKTLLSEDSDLRYDIEKEFGEDIYGADGMPDRKRLAARAFSDKERQQKLNALVHPAVRRYLRERFSEEAAENTPLVAVEASMLLESGSASDYDVILVVTADDNVRIERALERGNLTEDQIRRRMNLQMPQDDKIKYADFVIDNNGSLNELKSRCYDIYREICLDEKSGSPEQAV